MSDYEQANCYLCGEKIVNCYGELFKCLCCDHRFCLDCIINIYHYYTDLPFEEQDKIDKYGKIDGTDHWCPCYFREACCDTSGCLSSCEMKKVLKY